MNFPKPLFNLLYQCVVNEMERSDDRPAGYKEDLIKLEEMLSKEYDRQKEY